MTAQRRLQALGKQLLANGASADSPLAMVSASLPTTHVRMNYFDFERFHDEHGPAAQPWVDARSQKEKDDDPEFSRQHGAKMLMHYMIPFERPVIDGRQAPAGAITLQNQGFQLVSAPTQMERLDWYNRQRIMDTYLPETEETVRKALGCTRVLCFDANIRNEELAKPDEARTHHPGVAYNSGYAKNSPHNDHTLVSGPRRVRELLAEDPVNDEVLKHRFGILNLWRRWDGGNAWPLCCCAYDSMDYDQDMIRRHLVYSHRTGEGYTVRRRDDHRFYWFSDMNKNEAVLLKIFDSTPRESGIARGALHASFRPPTVTPNEPTRESMEMRCIFLFAPEELAAKASLRGGLVACNVQGRTMGVPGSDKMRKDE